MRIISFLAILILATTSCKSTKKATTNPADAGAQKVATLQNTWWQLTEVNFRPTITPIDGRETYIKLLEKNEMEGYTGCNKMGGSYTTGDNNSIQFTPVSTKMACADMSNETFLLNILRNANRYKIKDGLLYLYKDKEQLAYLKAMFF
jgi:heat shock protein HslJ